MSGWIAAAAFALVAGIDEIELGHPVRGFFVLICMVAAAFNAGYAGHRA